MLDFMEAKNKMNKFSYVRCCKRCDLLFRTMCKNSTICGTCDKKPKCYSIGMKTEGGDYR